MNYILSKNGRPFLTVGCPGRDNQAQADLQVILNVLLFGMDPQQAVAAPRFATQTLINSHYPRNYLPGQLDVEAGIPGEVRSSLAALGHKIVEADACGDGAIVTQRDPETGVMAAGAGPPPDYLRRRLVTRRFRPGYGNFGAGPHCLEHLRVGCHPANHRHRAGRAYLTPATRGRGTEKDAERLSRGPVSQVAQVHYLLPILQVPLDLDPEIDLVSPGAAPGAYGQGIPDSRGRPGVVEFGLDFKWPRLDTYYPSGCGIRHSLTFQHIGALAAASAHCAIIPASRRILARPTFQEIFECPNASRPTSSPST